MWQAAFVILLASCLVAIGVAQSDFIRNGTWTTYSVQPCDNPQQYEYELDIQKRKINRTHDGFNITIDLPYDITAEGFAIHIELYKKCEGGYKFHQNYDDPSFCALVNKYAQSNLERALAMANIDPPNCPIPKGLLSIRDFVVDYQEFPTEAIVGDFKALFHMVRVRDNVACVSADIGFLATDDDE